MFVKVWGSRGSTPVSGDDYKKYGSDTACVEVRTRAGDVILLDAGTGLGAFSRSVQGCGLKKPVICLSHLHLDHIQGLPFYSPLFSEAVTLYGPRPSEEISLADGLSRIFDGVLLPMRFSDLKGPRLVEVKVGEKFRIGDALIETIATNHPGGGIAWKISADGSTFVYSGDHEIPLTNKGEGKRIAESLFEFMANADLALVEAHFSGADHQNHIGWGHSDFSQWPDELAKRGVRHIVFTHFNPAYADAEIDKNLSAVKRDHPSLSLEAARAGYQYDFDDPANLASTLADCPICDFFQRSASLSDTHSVVDALLSEARKWGSADAGTIYLLENDELIFAASQNDTLFPKSAANKFAYLNARIPVNRASIAGYVAVTGSRLNIPDVYNLPEGCEYSFNKAFDLLKGYRTCSVLCMPLVNSKDKIIGVLQLINSMHGNAPVPFARQMENVIFRLASMATIPLERSLLITSIILRMLQTSALRDPKETAGHVYRVGSMAAELYHRWAEKHDVKPEELIACKGRLRLAAMLHDVGKVGIPDAVLKKPGRLDDAERGIMQQHAALGAGLFKDSISDIDNMARNIALHHHAKWDGSGYTGSAEIESPAGEQIPLEARITAIADVYDALVSRRCYKEAWDDARALEILRKDAGSHFDPELVQCFEEIIDTVQAIMERYSDKQEA